MSSSSSSKSIHKDKHNNHKRIGDYWKPSRGKGKSISKKGSKSNSKKKSKGKKLEQNQTARHGDFQTLAAHNMANLNSQGHKNHPHHVRS
jgi:hypothetical protein